MDQRIGVTHLTDRQVSRLGELVTGPVKAIWYAPETGEVFAAVKDLLTDQGKSELLAAVGALADTETPEEKAKAKTTAAIEKIKAKKGKELSQDDINEIVVALAEIAGLL